MSYRSATIRDTINNINRIYYLPAIQRPFVWETDQIIALFDSLMRGYPISTFLFWDLKEENWNNWDIYKFIDNFTYGSVHNEQASPRGQQVSLVLDGQQRLTSLLIGLCGTYTIRAKYKRRSNPAALTTMRLFINLLKDNSDEDIEDHELVYNFQFFESRPQQNSFNLWFPVGKILEFDSENVFERFVEDIIDSLPMAATRGDEKQIRRTLDRLYRVVWKDEIVSYYTERDQNYDRVLDIFVRANDGGTKLSKSDLLLSMITSKWNDRNAREEIYGFVDFINQEMPRRNNFDKDFILRACLVVSEVNCAYKVDNFTSNNLKIIERRWHDIRTAVQNTVKLINRFGLDRDTLTSANALMPIIYYLSRTKADLLGTTDFDRRNSERVRVWLAAALLGNAFGGSVNATLELARKLCRDALESSAEFPAAELAGGLTLRGRVIDFDDYRIGELLQTKYSQRNCYLSLSMLYSQVDLTGGDMHIDHIFPRSLFESRKLRESGLSEAFGERCRTLQDRLGNLQLLITRENLEKSDLSFEQWMD